MFSPTRYMKALRQFTPSLCLKEIPTFGRKYDISQPFDAHCCHTGTAIKHPVPDRVKPSFVIFDIGALWRSVSKITNDGLTQTQSGTGCFIALYSVTHMVTVGVKGLNMSVVHVMMLSHQCTMHNRRHSERWWKYTHVIVKSTANSNARPPTIAWLWSLTSSSSSSYHLFTQQHDKHE